MFKKKIVTEKKLNQLIHDWNDTTLRPKDISKKLGVKHFTMINWKQQLIKCGVKFVEKSAQGNGSIFANVAKKYNQSK